jgi:hypothetical protein
MGKPKIELSAYSDADWANNRDNRHSMSGIMVMFNGSPVVFKSRLQRIVALSTAEAEYIALSLCTQEVLWVKSLLNELEIPLEDPVCVYEDNQSAIAIAQNDGYQGRAKHIDIRHHFVRQQIKCGSITLCYIETKRQLADFLTKPIATQHFQDLLKQSNIRSVDSRGSVATIATVVGIGGNTLYGNSIGQNLGVSATQVHGMNHQFKSPSGTVSNRSVEGAAAPGI